MRLDQCLQTSPRNTVDRAVLAHTNRPTYRHERQGLGVSDNDPKIAVTGQVLGLSLVWLGEAETSTSSWLTRQLCRQTILLRRLGKPESSCRITRIYGAGTESPIPTIDPTLPLASGDAWHLRTSRTYEFELTRSCHFVYLRFHRGDEGREVSLYTPRRS